MKLVTTSIVGLLALSIAACDPQSEMAKKGVEKFGPTPTPSISPTPVEEPIDPADVVQVNVPERGPSLIVNRERNETTLTCNKYNRVMVNSADRKVTVRGACSQIMLNGDRNEVAAEAVTEIVFNGTENKVSHTKYANGKRPMVTQNKPGNTVEKVAAPAKK